MGYLHLIPRSPSENLGASGHRLFRPLPLETLKTINSKFIDSLNRKKIVNSFIFGSVDWQTYQPHENVKKTKNKIFF